MQHSRATRDLGRRGVSLAALALLMYPVHGVRAGEIYKSVDAEGHVVYSDHPDTAAAQKSVVRVNQPNPTDVARLAKETAILNAEETQRNRQKSVEDKQKAQQEHDKQAQCDSARNSYYAMKDARRLFQTDANGNRVYYPDTVADAKKEEARQAMQTACGT